MDVATLTGLPFEALALADAGGRLGVMVAVTLSGVGVGLACAT